MGIFRDISMQAPYRYWRRLFRYRLVWFNLEILNSENNVISNISGIQRDAQYLMINFIHNIQYLNMFRTSVVHLQERSYAVCCNLVCLDTL